MDGHGAPLVLHPVDPGVRKREGLAGHVLGHAARAADDEDLVARSPLEHIDADAGASVVVESGVARLPPGVEPPLRVLVSPQELERPFALALERRDVDDLCSRSREARALLGREVLAGTRQCLEARSIDHRCILDRARGPCTTASR